MKLSFFGGVGGVTGSKTEVAFNESKFLIDYGMFQGLRKYRIKNWKKYDLSKYKFMILTHAHIDHSGLIPTMIKNGFQGKIYCTYDTYNLCKVLLEDSAHIHEEDAKYINKKGCSSHKPALPLYTMEDVKRALKLFIPCSFKELIECNKNISFKFHWAGHILGSSFIELHLKDDKHKTKIIFSGDLGHDRSNTLIPPDLLPECDYLVMESTYGNKVHPRVDVKELLGIHINTILRRDGTVLIPAFSVGRTQDIIAILDELIKSKKIPKVPIFLDSPLSIKSNSIFTNTRNKEYLKVKNFRKILFDDITEITDIEESKKVANRKGPMIVVSASGMLDGGRILHHLKKKITCSRSGIILVGFQPVGTRGRKLLEGKEEISIFKESYPVKATVFNIESLSAHADYLDLIKWVKTAKKLPKLIILNHGEKQASENLRKILKYNYEINTTVAKEGESLYLEPSYSC